MLTKILSRGMPASGYLMVRFLKSLVLLPTLPIGLLLGWIIPDLTAGLVRLANIERYRAASYLGVPEPELLPRAARRRPGDVVALFKDKSFKRSLRCLLMPLVMIPELVVAVVSVAGAPSALISMATWKFNNGASLMALDVDSWTRALTLGPLQVLVSLSFLWWVAPPWRAATRRQHSICLRRPSPSWRRPGWSSGWRS